MAVPADRRFLQHVMSRGGVGATVLEVGAHDWQDGQGNMSTDVRATGRSWTGCDIQSGPGVDFTVDILDPAQVAAIEDRWDTVLLFNLLEHVYDPVAALTNALTLVVPGGSCVICGPAIWELHGFPRDYWRPLPDFYAAYAERHDLAVREMKWVLNEFAWIPNRPAKSRLLDVGDQFPGRLTAAKTYGRFRSVVSIGLQRSLNLTGRFTIFPRVGLGVVFQPVNGAG